MFEGSPQYNTQINKGKEKKRVSKFKGDLFAWLIYSSQNWSKKRR